MSLLAAGNLVVKRVRVNNLGPGGTAPGTTFINVAAPASLGLIVGSIGIAIPVADLIAGILPPTVRVTTTTNIRFGFVNASAGMKPIFAQSWNVFIFMPDGMIDLTV